MKLLSIIICTYNRSEFLQGLLSGLAKFVGGTAELEILIIDNNSSDNTREVASGFIGELPIRYYFEKKQGLSRAKNRGIKEAGAEHLCFLDDDAEVDSAWLQAARKIITGKKAEIFGGPIMPICKTAKPKWHRDEYESLKISDQEKILGNGEYLYGSNMFFPKSVFGRIGDFDVNLGMQGGKMFLGEDTEIQIRAREKGIKISYFPELIVQHNILSEKLKISFYTKRFIKLSIADAIIFNRLDDAYFSILRRCCKDFLKLCLLIPLYFFRSKIKYRYWQNYYLEKILPKIQYFIILYIKIFNPK